MRMKTTSLTLVPVSIKIIDQNGCKASLGDYLKWEEILLHQQITVMPTTLTEGARDGTIQVADILATSTKKTNLERVDSDLFIREGR
ncbi:hypothetical protein M0R45_014236 [Rubus argutus]|uniref:Uncharacterized protein n=1 Tax=Rubus argutus TaxID=59490 RepID=A0AAW1XL68_RUBAR